MKKKLQTIIISALVVAATAVPVFANVTGLMTSTSTTVEVVVKLGDVNNDNVIDAKDALAVLKYDVGLEQNDFTVAAADVNIDGEVDAKDALEILKHDVGLIEIGSADSITE